MHVSNAVGLRYCLCSLLHAVLPALIMLCLLRIRCLVHAVLPALVMLCLLRIRCLKQLKWFVTIYRDGVRPLVVIIWYWNHLIWRFLGLMNKYAMYSTLLSDKIHSRSNLMIFSDCHWFFCDGKYSGRTLSLIYSNVM